MLVSGSCVRLPVSRGQVIAMYWLTVPREYGNELLCKTTALLHGLMEKGQLSGLRTVGLFTGHHIYIYP